MKVIVGLSGGVDSSVTAWLLKQAGHEVEGLFMKNWEEQDDEICPSAQDIRDTLKVCERLDIPLHVENFSKQYYESVFQHFLDEYRQGRTPNPDILCNKEIKFKVFLDQAKALGADCIATGHYAGIKQQADGAYALLQGQDKNKDQSYFLYTLQQHQLSQSLFPLADIDKPEVRRIAAELSLITYDKKDSTGICFIGERSFTQFLAGYLGAQPGLIVDPEGNAIGEHNGVMYHTIGQRKGLNIGGLANGSGEAWYVSDKDLEKNHVIAVQGTDHPRLFHTDLTVNQLNWVHEPVTLGATYQAKIRYRQSPQTCTVTAIEPDAIKLHFQQPQRAVTLGQSAVLYQGESCLGGGVISARWSN